MLNILPYPSPNTKHIPASLSAMLSTSFTNKGKGKVGEDEESEANLKMGKEVVEQEHPAVEKETLMGEEEPKANKDKQLEEPDASEDSNSKNPKKTGSSEGGGEDSTGSSKESFPILLFGFIIDPAQRKTRKAGYSCDFCDKIFLTPQALGGHQNGHKWERNLKQGIQSINRAKRRNSYREYFSSPPPTPPHLQRCGYQYYGLDRMIHHQHAAGTASLNFDAAGNNNNSAIIIPHPQMASAAGFAIGNSAFQHHPEGAWFNPSGFKSNNNFSGMHPQIGEEVKEAHQQGSGKSGFDFVLLPMTNDQITGSHQQVTRSESDFGLLSKRGDGDEDTETQQDQASKTDLTLLRL